MSPLKVFKSTCSHPTHLLNTSLRHFSQETMGNQGLAVRSVWQSSAGSGREKRTEEPRTIRVAHTTVTSRRMMCRNTTALARKIWKDPLLSLISVFDLRGVFKTFKSSIGSPVQFHDGCLYFFSHIALRLAAKVKRGLIFLSLTIWFEGCRLHIFDAKLVLLAKSGIWLKKENVSVT